MTDTNKVTSFDKINSFYEIIEDDCDTPTIIEDEEELKLKRILAEIDLSKNTLQNSSKIIVSNTIEEQMLRAQYCKSLTDMFNFYKQYFQLCPIAGKKGFHCDLSEGGHFINASADVQEFRFHKALKEYFQFGYIIGEGKTKEGKFFKCPWKNENKTEYIKPNIGMLTGERSGVCVVDIDNKPYKNKKGEVGKTGLETFYELLQTYNNNFYINTITVKTGSSGLHLYFKYDERTKNLPSNSGYNQTAIDVKNNGGMVVFPGSIHPITGNIYNFWAGDNNEYQGQAFNNVSEMPEWLYNWLISDIKGREPKEPKTKSKYEQITNIDTNFLYDLVMNLDDDRAYNHNSYVNIIWAIRNCGGTIDLCYKFMEKCPEKYDRRCRENKIELAYNQGQYEIGLGFLINRLKEDKGGAFLHELFTKYNMNKIIEDSETFEDITYECLLKERLNDFGHKFINFSKEFNDLQSWLKSSFFMIEYGEKWIFRHPKRMWDYTEKAYNYLDHLSSLYKITLEQPEAEDDEKAMKPIKTDLGKLIKDCRFSTFKTKGVYDPNIVPLIPEKGQIRFNLLCLNWEEYKNDIIPYENIEPVIKESLETLYFKILADNNKEYFNYIMKWDCDCIFTPWKKNNVMLIFVSPNQGNGKSTRCKVLSPLIGSNFYVGTSEKKILNQKFDAIVENKILINLDDMGKKDVKDMAEIKNWLSRTTAVIERKGVDPYDCVDCMKLTGSSNDLDCVRLAITDRHFGVFEPSNDYVDIPEFWNQINSLFERKDYVRQAVSWFHYYYNQPEISNININAPASIPNTRIRVSMMASGENSIQQFLLSVADRSYVMKDMKIKDVDEIHYIDASYMFVEYINCSVNLHKYDKDKLFDMRNFKKHMEQYFGRSEQRRIPKTKNNIYHSHDDAMKPYFYSFTIMNILRSFKKMDLIDKWKNEPLDEKADIENEIKELEQRLTELRKMLKK